MTFIATYADGYQVEVLAHLTTDAPDFVRITGNNITVLQAAGTRTIVVTGSYSDGGATQAATMRIITHGPESNWVRTQVTSGGDIFAMDYRPDGQQLAAAGSSGAVSLYKVGVSPTTYEWQTEVAAHERSIRGLFYTSNNQLVTLGEDGRVRTWNLNSLDGHVSEYSHDAVITCSAYSGDGYVVFGDNLGRVQLLSLARNRIVWSATVHDKQVRAVAIDADSVLSGGDDNKAVLSKRLDGSRIMRYTGYSDPVIAVGIQNGMTYTVSEDKRLAEWTKGTVDDNLWEYFLPGIPTAMRQTADRLYVTVGSPVKSLVGGFPVVTGFGSTTWVYDNNGLLQQQLEHPPKLGKVSALAISPDGNYLLTGRSSVVVRDIDPLTGELVFRHFEFHSAQFWDTARSSYRGSLDHNGSIQSARITRDGKWLYSQSPQRVFQWQFGATTSRTKLLETGYDVPFQFDGLQMSDDASGIVGTRVGETIYLMNGAQRLLRMSVHQQDCALFDLSPDGNRLISYGDNLRLWDIGVTFPTVIYETSEKPADCLAFFWQDIQGRQGDWLVGISQPEPFLAIMNNRGLQFSGGTITNNGLIKATVAVSRNQSRCALVVQPIGEFGPLDLAHVFVYDLRSEGQGIYPKLLRQFECESRDAKVAVALSDDGSLLFYGGAPVDDQGTTMGQLYDISTGRLLYSFAPPSMGTMGNCGPAAAQFTQNDGALMISWGEGYSSIFARQGLFKLEIAPAVKSVAAGDQITFQATAVYADGTRFDVTDSSRWSWNTNVYASLNGSQLTVARAAPLGAEMKVHADYTSQGATVSGSATLAVRAAGFLELVADPTKRTVTPNSEIHFRFYARMVDGTLVDVTTNTVLTATPADRVEIHGPRVWVPPLTQSGYVQVLARCVLAGDDRTVNCTVDVRDPFATGDPGDFNADNRVDIADVLIFVGHYGETSSSSTWDPRFDLNSNGVIDYPDLLALVGLFGTVYGDSISSGIPTAGVSTGRVAWAKIATPLVQLRAEGPGRSVAVGEEFEMRIYGREISPEAHGISGVFLDVLFDPALVEVVPPLNPSTVMAAPYNSLLAHGEVTADGIKGLGGACLSGGVGDGEEALLATLKLRAKQAGDAAISLSPSDCGLALTRPVGLLPSWAVDTGDVCQVSIAAQGEFAVQFQVVGGGLAQILKCGVKAGATAGFDPQEGDAAGLPRGSEGEGAWMDCVGNQLSVDLRPKDFRQLWKLQVVLPAFSTAERAWTLAWRAVVPPDGTRLLMIPSDSAGNPARGPRLSLDKPGTLTLTNSGGDPKSCNFLVVWDAGAIENVTLRAGWNMVGCALEPDGDSTRALLENPAVLAVLDWSPDWGYSVPESLDAASGYLVYANADTSTRLTGIAALPGIAPLPEGWNLVSERVRATSAANPTTPAVTPPASAGSESTTLASETAGWIYIGPSEAANGDKP